MKFFLYLQAITCALMLVAWRNAATVAGADFFVATDGNDDHPGSEAQPFATLERARDAVRHWRTSAGAGDRATVRLRGGVYELSRTFTLTVEDSGTEEAPVVWRNYQSERVALSGGHRIDNFQPVTDAGVLQRLPEVARGQVLQADVNAAGVTDFGEVATAGKRLELFCHGRPMTLARWPNEGFARVVDVTGGQPITTHGIKGDAIGKFVYAEEQPSRWTAEPDVWLCGYWFWDWSDGRQRVKAIDTANRTIELEPPHHGYGYRKGQRYFAFNVLAELDSPGEWYLDRQRGVLYFWPPAEGPGEATLSVLPTLVSVNNASWITLRGLVLENSRATAVTIDGGEGVRVGGCLIRNTGGWGVTVRGGANHGVVGCDIEQTGEGGVSLSGGDRLTLTPAGHLAENNHIHHYARLVRTYRPAVGLGGVGNRVSHNLIHDAPHNAILLGGNDHVIELNDIHHVCQETGDVGAFYMGRDWTMRGNLIRHNYFRELSGPGLHGAMAVYLDDAASGTTIFGNIFYRASRAAFIGGGRDNIVENNVFVECQPSVHVDARGLGWMHETVAPGGTMPQRLAAMPYQRPPWSTRYPELARILEENPPAPHGNRVVRNISVGGPWRNVEKAAEPGVVFENNLVDQDPAFVDADNLNFQLRPDSPAWKLGFQKIPIEQIGLQQDEWRAENEMMRRSTFVAMTCTAVCASTQLPADDRTRAGGSVTGVAPRDTAPPRIPFPAALDAAAVVQSRIGDIHREALMLGNGDLHGLLWERNGTLCLRVAKNDVWDARVDTSQDVPLMQVDVPNQTWSGGGYPPSWKKPYPHPRCAAVVRIGAAAAEPGVWQCIRSGGKVNQWSRREEDGVMAIEGAPGASAGYRWKLDPAQVGTFTALKFRISGSPGAKYYVNVLASAGKHPVESGWRDTPETQQEVSFPIPDGSQVAAVELYVMTPDGARVENRMGGIVLAGGEQPVVITPGMVDPKIKSAWLDLRRAVAELDNLDAGCTRVRVLADRNVFLIESDEEVSLEEIKSSELPAAELGETDGVKWLSLKMPGDPDYPGMEYALAAAGSGPYQAVALVTSFETHGNVRDAAVRLARETAAADLSALIARHENAWAQFWSASGVELDDPDFQLWWYRMVYYLRCFAAPQAMPVGLFAGLASDNTPWHGDYHHNYNAWQPYWTPFIINHPELAEPWVRYMNDMLPRLRWLAKTTYGCEGACVGISTFAFEPDPAECQSVNRRQIAIPPYGYTLGMAGMSAQVLWHAHLYRPDRKYLDEAIYPVLREVALFYCSFAEKCPRDTEGKAKFGPSYSPEHGRFGVANVPFDLAYARFTLSAAIAAAGELGRDAELAERFRMALELLPPYPTAPDAAGQPVVVDWAGCKFREIRQHNITVPAVPVFPGEQVTRFSPEPEQELFRNTIRQTNHRGCNSTIMFSVAKARLSMLDAFEDARQYYRPEVQPNGMFHWPMHGFYLSESVGIAAMISEFLLQSVENTIRVFPCWPKEKDARFADLRAQGGFLVSAEQRQGQVIRLEVTSTVGGPLRLLSPWPAIALDGRTLQPDSRGIVEVATRPDEHLVFAAE